MRTISAVLLVVALLFHQAANSQEPERAQVNPTLSAQDDHYLARQAAVFLDTVRGVLAEQLPTPKPGLERQMAFSLLDAVTHETYAPNRPELIAFHHERIGAAVAEIESTTVTEGARIWQLYNHGFVVKTKR
jgi:hypothetical protein